MFEGHILYQEGNCSCLDVQVSCLEAQVPCQQAWVLWTNAVYDWTGRLNLSVGKESACNARDLGSIPGSGRYPGEGNGNLLQDSCLENPTDTGAWRVTVHEVTKSQT